MDAYTDYKKPNKLPSTVEILIDKWNKNSITGRDKYTTAEFKMNKLHTPDYFQFSF